MGSSDNAMDSPFIIAAAFTSTTTMIPPPRPLCLSAEIGSMTRQAALRSRTLLGGLCEVLSARRALYAVAPAPTTQLPPAWNVVLDVTVQDYLKELYRRHAVSGRNELYAHFNR